MRASHRAEDVVGALDVGHPIADRFAGGVFQGGGASRHRLDGGAQQAHSEDVEGLTAHVFGAHVDDALQAEARTHGGGGHAVLTSPGFGNDPLFAHAQGQQRLAKGVVDLVGAGVVEVLALEPDAGAALGAAVVLAEALGFIEGAGPAHVIAQKRVEAIGESLVLPSFSGGRFQLSQGWHQGFRNVLTAKTAEAAQAIGACGFIQGRGVGQRAGHRRNQAAGSLGSRWGQGRPAIGLKDLDATPLTAAAVGAGVSQVQAHFRARFLAMGIAEAHLQHLHIEWW